jgi:hypothetical protein
MTISKKAKVLERRFSNRDKDKCDFDARTTWPRSSTEAKNQNRQRRLVDVAKSQMPPTGEVIKLGRENNRSARL